MGASATTQAAAPRRQYRPKPGSFTADILEFCDVPRETHEVTEWLGYAERTRSALRDLVKAGRLVNLEAGTGKHGGLYVRADRAPVLVERICWHPASAPLDDECQVLVSVQRPGGIDTREGYRCAGVWTCAVTDKPLRGEVIAWAHKPSGPEGA